MCRIDNFFERLAGASILWKSIKERGSGHYKTGKVEPIDLYKDAGILPDFAIGNIIKYAYRLKQKGLNESDIHKIIHYAEMLLVVLMENSVTTAGPIEDDGDITIYPPQEEK